jgi:hypothetical protein
MYHRLLFTLVLAISLSVASAEEISVELPSYCQHFPTMDPVEIKKYLKSQNQSEALYRECLQTGKPVSLTFGDLLQNYLEIEKHQYQFNIKSLRNRMSTQSIDSILKSKSAYLNLFGAADDHKSAQKLRGCLQTNWKNPELGNLLDRYQHRQKKEQRNKVGLTQEQQERKFLQTHMIKAMTVAALAQRDDEHSKRKLHSMVKNNPLLFTVENDPSFTDWFNYQVKPSPLAKKMVHGIHPAMLQEFFMSLEDGKSNQFFADYKDQLNKHFEQKIDTLSNREQVKEGISNHLERLNESAEYICDHQDDAGLHLFPLQVKQAFADSYNGKNGVKDLIEDISAYCYLLRNDPPRDLNAFTWKSGVGLSLVGVGTLAQFVPFLGNIVGYGLILSGSSILAYEGTTNYLDAKGELLTSEAMYSAGWAQYHEVLNKRGQYSDKIFDLAIEGTVILDAAALIKAGKLVARARMANIDGDAVRMFKQNRALIKKGDPKLFREQVWQRHKNSQLRIKQSNPENSPVAIAREQLMLYNRNDRIPAFYRYGEDGTDTFGAVDVLVDASKREGDEFDHALKEAHHWLDQYNTYPKRLNSKIDDGFSVQTQLESLAPYQKMSRKEFHLLQQEEGGRAVEVLVTTIRDGVPVKEKIPFPSYNQLRSYLRSLKKKQKEIFASNTFNEQRRSSEMFSVMTDQAKGYRKLTFLQERLSHIPVAARTKDQKALLKAIDNSFQKDFLMPRDDAIFHLQGQELKGEIRDIFRSTKQRLKLRETSKFSLGRIASEEIGSSSTVKSLVKYTGLATVTGGLTATGKGIIDQYQSESELAVQIAEAQNMLDSVIRHLHFRGGTFEEVTCASEPRMWTFENVCYPKLARRFILPHVIRAIKNPVYKLEKDREVMSKLTFFRRHMLDLRHQMKGAETFNLAIKDLKANGLREAARQQFLDQAKRMAGDPVMVEDLSSILSEPDQEQEQVLLAKFSQKYQGSPIVDVVKHYLATEDQVVKSIADSATLPLEIQQQLKQAISKSTQ